jgi:nucleoside-diphosphate-sugar epimerase
MCVYNSDGKEFISAYASFITGAPADKDIICLEDCDLLILGYLDLQELYKMDPVYERTGRLIAEMLFINWQQRVKSLLLDVAEGMDVLFHGINFPYQHWYKLMKPVTKLVIETARQNGSTILFPGNIYAYGNVIEPIKEETVPNPTTKKGMLRLELEEVLEQATEDGKCRVINLRLPDFWGPNVTNGLIKPLFGNAAQRKPMVWMVRADMPHQFVYTPDAARLFYKLSRETDLPSYYILNYGGEVYSSVAELAREISHEAESPPKLKLYSKATLKMLGLFVPVVRELNENIYQFENCIQLDDSKIRAIYPELRETCFQVALRETINWYRHGIYG